MKKREELQISISPKGYYWYLEQYGSLIKSDYLLISVCLAIPACTHYDSSILLDTNNVSKALSSRPFITASLNNFLNEIILMYKNKILIKYKWCIKITEYIVTTKHDTILLLKMINLMTMILTSINYIALNKSLTAWKIRKRTKGTINMRNILKREGCAHKPREEKS